jgi:subtilisin family serine protease
MDMALSECRNISQCKQKRQCSLLLGLYFRLRFLISSFCICSVAGTIAAIDNGFGVVGVAAGATIVPVKILNAQGKGFLGGLLQALEWVTEHANIGDVVNISLGGNINDSVDEAVRQAAKKGLLIVLSAGNDSSLASERSPSRINHRNIFTVAATTENDELARFSNIGKPPVDCAAPGVGILSTFKDGQYATMQGTSMAAPHAAGALLLGYRPNNKRTRRRGGGGAAVRDANGNRYPIVSIKQ